MCISKQHSLLIEIYIYCLFCALVYTLKPICERDLSWGLCLHSVFTAITTTTIIIIMVIVIYFMNSRHFDGTL